MKRYPDFAGLDFDYYRWIVEHATKFDFSELVYSSKLLPVSISARLRRVLALAVVSSDLKNWSLSIFQPVFQLNG